MPRNNVLLQRLLAPRQVQLTHGRVFFAKYQKVGREILPEQVKIRKTYVRKIEPRRQHHRRKKQASRSPDSNMIFSVIDLGRQAAGSRLGKMIIKDAVDYIPTAYKKIKNKKKS